MDKKTSFWKKVRAGLGFKGPKTVRVFGIARVSTDAQAKGLDEQQDNAAQATPKT